MRILMVTMSMGLGGAETHILELSKGLKAMGHDVLLCSNGGVYVKELEEAGIRHYQAPLHIRTRASLSEGWQVLSRILKTERPDIVHAHARIPALLCSELCRRHHIPFVTTAHYNFRTSGLLKHLTRWGERTIAVSEDLKHYLMDNYSIPENHITVTVNGIATDKFSPQADAGNLYEEFNLPRDGQYVCTVSRMDANACRAAEILIEGAKTPCRRNPKLYVIIVGQGGRFEELKEKAEQVNAIVGRRCVIMTGGRTDISHFTALCDVFVGVSRSALEAMACEKPTILAGNQGYLGLYTEAVLPQCIATNFTCRGIDYPSPSAVWDSVVPLLEGRTPEGITMEEIRKQSRSIILSNYSVDRMARDCEGVYLEILKENRHRNFDFVVTGYYGHNNSGDEALLSAVVRNLQRTCPQSPICALTSAPITTENTCNVTAVQRFNLPAVDRVFSHGKVLIFGGGNLIQDITSTKSLLYYLTLLRMARHRGMKTMLYANGIGPVIKESNRQRAAKVLNQCDIITLRDADSLKLLRSMGVNRPMIRLTADETLTLPVPDAAFCQQALRGFQLDSKPYILVSVRQFKNTTPEFFQSLADAVSQLAHSRGLEVVLVPLHADADPEASKHFRSLLTCPSRFLPHPRTLPEMLSIIMGSQAVVGMRMHALVFAACCHVPFVGLAYDPKVKSFVGGFPSLACYDMPHFDATGFRSTMDRLLDHRDEIASEIENVVTEWQKLAAENAKLARQLLLATPTTPIRDQKGDNT